MASDVILCISDLHFPYNHHHAIPFIQALFKEYCKGNKYKIILTGDETDQHANSYHETSPELYGSEHEFQAAIESLKKLYDMFPEAHILDSNHGSLVARKAKTAGLPARAIKSNREILEAPSGWQWHPELVLKSGKRDIYFHHGLSANVEQASKAQSMCMVQGHYHTKFEIRYWANYTNIYWGMTVGCLVDRKSYAMAYGKNYTYKPILGCGVIIQGYPILIPMVLNSKGDWIGNV